MAKSLDKKAQMMVKQSLMFSFKIPAVHLLGSVVWFPNQFLLEKLPLMAKSLDKKAQMMVKQSHVFYF